MKQADLKLVLKPGTPMRPWPVAVDACCFFRTAHSDSRLMAAAMPICPEELRKAHS